MANGPAFPQTLAYQTAAGTLYNTYTTAKTVINQSELVTLPANYLKPHSSFRVRAMGGLSNVVTAQPTFTFQIMMGSIAAWTSGAIATTTTAHTLIPFDLEVMLRVDSLSTTAGSTATAAKFLGMGKLNGIMWTVAAGADSTTVVGTLPVPATAPAVGTGFDSSIANIMDFFVGIQTSNAGNGIQLYHYSVEQLSGFA
jgi:hypothetical protein